MHAALSQGEGDRPGVHRQTCPLGRVHLLKAHLLAVLDELLFDNVQTLVYAGPGPLYAANLVISPLVGGLLPPVPPLLHLPGLLWFRPLRLHQDDVAPALLLQLLDISSILANQLAAKVVWYVELIAHELSMISPEEWGPGGPEYVGGYRLEFDMSWTELKDCDRRGNEIQMINKILDTSQAVSFNFLPSQYQAGLALEQSKHKGEGQKEHTEVLQDTVWK